MSVFSGAFIEDLLGRLFLNWTYMFIGFCVIYCNLYKLKL